MMAFPLLGTQGHKATGRILCIFLTFSIQVFTGKTFPWTSKTVVFHNVPASNWLWHLSSSKSLLENNSTLLFDGSLLTKHYPQSRLVPKKWPKCQAAKSIRQNAQ
jgi:hypothetical protein